MRLEQIAENLDRLSHAHADAGSEWFRLHSIAATKAEREEAMSYGMAEIDVALACDLERRNVLREMWNLNHTQVKEFAANFEGEMKRMGAIE